MFNSLYRRGAGERRACEAACSRALGSDHLHRSLTARASDSLSNKPFRVVLAFVIAEIGSRRTVTTGLVIVAASLAILVATSTAANSVLLVRDADPLQPSTSAPALPSIAQLNDLDLGRILGAVGWVVGIVSGSMQILSWRASKRKDKAQSAVIETFLTDYDAKVSKEEGETLRERVEELRRQLAVGVPAQARTAALEAQQKQIVDLISRQYAELEGLSQDRAALVQTLGTLDPGVQELLRYRATPRPSDSVRYIGLALLAFFVMFPGGMIEWLAYNVFSYEFSEHNLTQIAVATFLMLLTPLAIFLPMACPARWIGTRQRVRRVGSSFFVAAATCIIVSVTWAVGLQINTGSLADYATTALVVLSIILLSAAFLVRRWGYWGSSNRARFRSSCSHGAQPKPTDTALAARLPEVCEESLAPGTAACAPVGCAGSTGVRCDDATSDVLGIAHPRRQASAGEDAASVSIRRNVGGTACRIAGGCGADSRWRPCWPPLESRG